MLSEQEGYAQDKTYFDLMLEELDRANIVISEYLNLAPGRSVDLQPQDLNRVVKTIYPVLETAAQSHRMNIELDLDQPAMALSDQKEIRQLILNLVHNGFEAMIPGGTLTIGTTVEGNAATLFIKDQGPGLDPNIIAKLGTPFITAKGTGLGLSICYSIATRHNAKLEVETGAGGTTFKLCFPPIDVKP